MEFPDLVQVKKKNTVVQKKMDRSGIPHLKKCILRKRDTESFEIVSIGKKLFSLNELHFLTHSLILVKLIRNWHH